MQNLQLITRELINEMLTPEEEREWMTYTAHLPKHELDEAREHLVSAGVITKALVRVMSEGAAPESEAVQKLMHQHNQLMLRYRLRERLVTRGNWNEQITRKVHAMGMKLMLRMASPDGSVSGQQVFNFCCRARQASKWGKALDRIASEAMALEARQADVHSAAAQALAEDLAEVCEAHALGDPVLYGRWYIEFGMMVLDDGWVPVDEPHRKAWAWLIDAVEASRRPAGLRAAAAW